MGEGPGTGDRGRGTWGLALAVALVSACRREAVTPVIRFEYGRVRVDGLPERDRQRLLGGDQTRVHVTAEAGPPDSSLPALAGRWELQDSGIVFIPRFEPSGGISVAVSIDTAGIAGRRGASLVRRFPIRAAPAGSPLTEVTIFPSAAVLPENLLRWYFEFTEPMRPGQALSHVRLEDDGGQPVANAWLEVGEELWSPDRRRLTLLFDPGRVKRGIRTNLEQGRPLVAGRWYRLSIDSSWRDARDRPLRHGATKRFRVGPALSAGPDPASWWMDLPAAGTSGPITVRFPAPIDHALGPRLVLVETEAGRPIAGQAAVDKGDLRWSFFPASRWPAGRYRLAVSPELEDVAGNRPGRPFDRELTAAPASPPALTRPFLIR